MHNLTVNVNQARNMIEQCVLAGLVPMVSGSPAIGKSSIVKAVAASYGLKLIDMRLSQCDPTDLSGFPTVNADTGKACYAPMSTFPIQGDAVPSGYNGWMIFLDEISSAPQTVQSAAYKLVLDRMVGEHHLHDNVAVVAAGNLETDNAIVEPMSTALQSRMSHMELHVDSDIWLDWAVQEGIDHRITAYIRFKPDQLYNFKPDHTDKTYASPRTWEFADRLLKVNQGELTTDTTALLIGTVGQGAGREFANFTKIYGDLPTLAQIVANPGGIRVPSEPSVLYALSGSMANNASTDNIERLMPFITRMPLEFQAITLRDIVSRHPELFEHECVSEWVGNNTDLF